MRGQMSDRFNRKIEDGEQSQRGVTPRLRSQLFVYPEISTPPTSPDSVLLSGLLLIRRSDVYCRRATIGSTDAARRAGTRHATSAAISSVDATAMSVTGLPGSTP